jgi:signal transduction histidine kinase
MQASYEPTELDTLTRDLASAFRWAIERAQLRFSVECNAVRTPLSNVVSWSRLLQKKYLGADEYVRRGLNIIVDNAQSQAQVISDLLDMSRIVSGKIQLEVEPCDLTQLVESAVISHRPTAEAKRIQLQLAPIHEPLLVDLHGGTVQADSEGEGRGATGSPSCARCARSAVPLICRRSL